MVLRYTYRFQPHGETVNLTTSMDYNPAFRGWNTQQRLEAWAGTWQALKHMLPKDAEWTSIAYPVEQFVSIENPAVKKEGQQKP